MCSTQADKILGNCGCVAVASFFGMSSALLYTFSVGEGKEGKKEHLAQTEFQ
jgi:hypothetical protein